MLQFLETLLMKHRYVGVMFRRVRCRRVRCRRGHLFLILMDEGAGVGYNTSRQCVVSIYTFILQIHVQKILWGR